MGEKNDVFIRLNNPILWGVLTTGLLFLLGTWSAFLPVCSIEMAGTVCGETKWQYLYGAPPNEVGDALAGFAGSLAFLWLIATVWLQSQELSAQRRELREQRLATQDMASAQAQQVKLLAIQGKIFETEQQERLEDRAERQLEARLFELRQEIIDLSRQNKLFSWFTGQNDYNLLRVQKNRSRDNLDQFFIVPSQTISARMSGFRDARDGKVDPPDVYYEGNAETDGIGNILTLGKELMNLEGELSSDQRIRLRTLKLNYSIQELSKLENEPEGYVISIGVGS